MSVDAGDVIANALMASDITTDDTEIKIDDMCEKKLFSLNCEGGQMFDLTGETLTSDVGSDGWSKNLPDALGDCDLGMFGDGFQLCYVDAVPPEHNGYEEVRKIPAPVQPGTASSQIDRGDCTSNNGLGEFNQEAVDGKADQTIKGPARWSEGKTTLFLTLLKRFESEFVCRLRPKCSILNSIAGIMSATYTDVDKDLCYKKWSNLLRTYRTYKEKNQKDWLYYDDMERLSASVGTRGMTAKQIRQRNRAFEYSKSRVRTFMNKTDEMQGKINRSILNFQQKLNQLQKQSDEHLKSIFSILEENFHGGEIQHARNEIGNTFDDTCENTSTSDSICDVDPNLIVIDSDIVDPQTQLPESSNSPLRSNYDLLNISMEVPTLSDEVSHPKYSVDVRTSADSEMVVATNRDSGHETDTEVLNENVEYLIPMEQNSWNSWDSLNSENQLSSTISASASLIPINAPSIEINEPVQLIPQSDGTFHFVSLPDQNQNAPVSEHSHLFGSLKKMTFTSSEGQYESAECDTRKYEDLETEQMDRGDASSTGSKENDNNATSENELVILSRSQLDNINSIVPLETTAVSLQLLPCTDDTFKLVVCPREIPEEENVDTEIMSCSLTESESGAKNPESWSLSIFTPICPVVNIHPPEPEVEQIRNGECISDGLASESLLEHPETID